MSKKSPSIGVAFMTHCAKHHLKHCLPSILNSSLHPRVLVVNSSSNDGTVEEAQKLGAEVLVIPRQSFNHGLTRELARKTLGTDIAVMMTPDAYAIDNQMLEKLIQPLLKKQAVISYARQIPHDGANLFEEFARHFNYPAESQLRTIHDIKKYGSYTFFSSNACAAYLNSALDQIGGFPPVLLGEDTCTVAKLLERGEAIAYTAEAIVKHSHRYSLMQEFRRHFDTGLARKEFEHLIRLGGKDERRGMQYVTKLLKHVSRKNPLLLPYAFVQSATKWMAYRLGRRSVNAPVKFKKALTSQDFYWDSDVFLNK